MAHETVPGDRGVYFDIARNAKARSDMIELWGGDPCPRCGNPLDWDEIGDDRDPIVFCPRAPDRCSFVANGYPHREPDRDA